MLCQCIEPSLGDALNDPLVQALMAADGVDPLALGALMRETARKIELGARGSATAQPPRGRVTEGSFATSMASREVRPRDC